MSDELWTFKYHPESLDDMIVDLRIKVKFEKILKEVPNILLYGTPGVGKGTFTQILLKKTGYDSMWINASDHTGIDVIREKIRPFATSAALTKRKVIVLNEADSLTSGPQGAQKMLRQLMEDVSKFCRFIFLCNYENNIIPELKSRLQVIKVENPPRKEIGKMCLKILKQEKIKYDSKDVIDIVKKTYPDIRKCINVLQENTIKGKLTGSMISASESTWREIFNAIKEKNIEKVRELLKSNYIDYPSLYEYIYENVGEFDNPGPAILKIGKFLYQDSTIAIKEINFIAFVCELMFEEII